MAERSRSNLHYVRSILRKTWQHPSNRHRRIRAIGRTVGWQVRKRLRPGPRDVDYFGWKLRCYSDSNSASNVIYFTEMYDTDEMSFMQRYLRAGDGFIDGGANIGTYSLLARRLVGREGLVEAFEPNPVAARRMRENLDLNGIDNVRVHSVALGETVGEVEFLEGLDVSNRVHSATDGDHPTRTVQMATLDGTLGESQFALGKLDLEGHETNALRGALGRLSRADPPVWQLEILDHQLARAGSDRHEMIGLLAEHRYDFATYSSELGIRFVDAEALPAGNVWAVHQSVRDVVQTRLGSVAG